MRRGALAQEALFLFADTDRTFRRVLTVMLSFYFLLVFLIRLKGETLLPSVSVAPADEPPRIARLLTERPKTAPAPEPPPPLLKVETPPPLSPPKVEPPPAPPPEKIEKAKVEKTPAAPSATADKEEPASTKPAPRERVKKVGLLGLLGGGKGSAPPLGGFSALKDLPSLPPEEKATAPDPEKGFQDGSKEEINKFRERVLSEQEKRLAQPSGGTAGGVREAEGGRLEVSKLKPLPSTLSGSARTPKEIDAVVYQNREKLLKIYNLFLKKNPSLQGSLTLEFVISPEGRVLECHVLTSLVKDSAFEEAIVRETLEWKFPAIEGGATTVLYPISFSPAG